MREFALLALLLPGLALAQSAERSPDAARSVPVTALAQAGQADDPSDTGDAAPLQLPAVTITATRTPRRVSEVAASVSVIPAREIERSQAASLGEALGKLAGVAVEGGPRASAEFINIRGLSGPRVLVVVDGARQNFLGGHRTNLLIEPELLRTAELLRGPASALWGSDALGGVVVLTTRDAADFLQRDAPLAARLRLGYESVNRERLASGIFAGRLGSLDAVASVSLRDSDDYRHASGAREPHSAQRVQGGLAKLSWLPQISPHRLGMTAQSFVQKSRAPSNPAGAVGETNPLLDRVSDMRYLVAQYGFNSAGNSPIENVQLNLYRDQLEIREERVDAPRSDRTFFATDGASGHLSVAAPGATLLTLGAEAFQDSARATRDGAPRPQYPDAQRSLAGAFVQAEFALARLSLAPGLRYDRYHASSRQDDSASTRDSAVSPKLGAVLALAPGVNLRGSYNGGFRAPGLIEIYAAGQHFLGNNFVPNPGLKPEKARNLELGFSLERSGWGDSHRITAAGALYRNRIRDFIELYVEATSEFPAARCIAPMPPVGCVNRNADGTLNPATPPVFVGGSTGSRNLESATLHGGELEAAYAIGGFTLGASYSQSRGAGDAGGQPLASIAADRLRTTLAVDGRSGVSGAISFSRHFAQTRVPTFVDEDGNPRNVVPATPAYNILDLSLVYEPLGAMGDSGRRWGLVAPRLVAGVDNLGNTAYRDHLNVLPSPGRNLRMSFSTGF